MDATVVLRSSELQGPLEITLIHFIFKMENLRARECRAARDLVLVVTELALERKGRDRKGKTQRSW